MERKAFSFQVCRARPNPQRSPIRNVNPPKAQIARKTPTTYAKRPHTSRSARGILLKMASNQVATVVMVDHCPAKNAYPRRTEPPTRSLRTHSGRQFRPQLGKWLQPEFTLSHQISNATRLRCNHSNCLLPPWPQIQRG